MVVFLLLEREGVINREGIRPVYGTVQKPVNLTSSGLSAMSWRAKRLVSDCVGPGRYMLPPGLLVLSLGMEAD